ncbi:hypothetical protein ACTG5S_06565 [Pasteurella multocida]
MMQSILFHMMKKVLTLTMPVLLVLLLTSCASKPVAQVCPSIPVALLAHLDKTGFNGNTYGSGRFKVRSNTQT